MSKPRTGKQNNSLHVFCRELANELNEKGITQGEFAKAFEVDNTMESVKEVLKEASFKKYLEKSTAKLSTIELQGIYEETMRVIAFHPEWNLKHIDWPSKETK
jgi:hypothetical protein